MTDPHSPGALPASPGPDDRPAPPDALVAGLFAALLGGGVWALLVLLTRYEIGWVAWGVGGLVGFAMSRKTDVRGRPIAVRGAALATLGLVLGKVLIVLVAQKPLMVDEVLADRRLMAQAATYDLDQRHAFPDSVQAWLDSLVPGDTLPDTLAQQMFIGGFARADTATRAERRQMAERYVGVVLAEIPFFDRLSWQLSAWDLLWFGLAISTAWRMLNPPRTAVQVETADEEPTDSEAPPPDG